MKVGMIAEEVSKKQRDCEADLLKAEPALLAAQEALNTLNKANLTELKSFGSPPGAVTNVTAAVMVLLAPSGKVAKDRSWKAAKVRSTYARTTLAHRSPLVLMRLFPNYAATTTKSFRNDEVSHNQCTSETRL